jgi:hypothetical protein
MDTVYIHPSQWSWWDGDQNNVITHGDYSFVLMSASGFGTIIRVDMRDMSVDGPVTIPGSIGDGHQQPGLLVIDGKLVAFKGAYGAGAGLDLVAMYAESSGAYDSPTWGSFGLWTALPLNSEGTAGYCFPVLTSEGTVLLFHLERAGNNYAPPSDCLYYRKTAHQTWAQGVWQKLISAPNRSAAGTIAGTTWDPAIYLSRPMVHTIDSEERVSVAFGLFWAEAGVNYDSVFSAQRRTGFIYSDDDGLTWKRADGSVLSLPVATNVTDPVLFARTGYNRFYGWVDYDDDRPLVFVDTFTITPSGTRTIAHRGLSVCRWNGSHWSEVEIDPSSEGTVYYPTTGTIRDYAAPKAMKSGGVWRVFSFRDDGTADDPFSSMKVDESADLEMWSPGEPLFSNSDATPNRQFRLTRYQGSACLWRSYAADTGAYAAYGTDVQLEVVAGVHGYDLADSFVWQQASGALSARSRVEAAALPVATASGSVQTVLTTHVAAGQVLDGYDLADSFRWQTANGAVQVAAQVEASAVVAEGDVTETIHWPLSATGGRIGPSAIGRRLTMTGEHTNRRHP